MIASFLMGLVGGQRAMTPLAAVSLAAALGKLPADTSAPRFIAHPLAAAGAVALALGEFSGDKLKAVPGRTEPASLAARFAISAFAGAALAPRRQRALAATLGGTTAVAAAYLGSRARSAAMRHNGQVSTGLAEDAIVIVSAIAILQTLAASRTRRAQAGKINPPTEAGRAPVPKLT